MPKNRSCVAANHFEFPTDFLKSLPYPDRVTINAKVNVSPKDALYFGEPVVPQYKDDSSSSSGCNNPTSGVSDLDIISFGKSSSSSVSWSDDLDAEATQRVQREFDRMERVLQGKEPIPSHYNRDEYEQWIRTFPQLSITGSKMKCLVSDKHTHEPQHNYEEIIACHSDISCDSDATSTINSVKKSVIDEIFQRISSKLLHPANSNTAINEISKFKNNRCTTEHKFEKTILNNAQNFNSFLRISPVFLQQSAVRSFNTRQPSSHSVSKSEKLASKWMQEESVEYLSLPYLSTASAKNASLKTKVASNKSRCSSKVSTDKNSYIMLPPIKTLSLPMGNHYRSISATPRQPPKGLSAVSIKTNSRLGSKKPQLQVVSNVSDLELKNKYLKRL